MKVSIIGSGRMGKGIVKTLAPFIKNIDWGSRQPEKLETILEEMNLTNVTAVSHERALEADIIIHTLWFKDLIPWAEQYKDYLKDKILIDIVNPFTEDFTDFTLEWGHSAAEELQRKLPYTKVVGAFKNTFAKVFDQPVHNGLISDVYVTSNYDDAREKVMELLSGIPFRVINAGTLRNNRVIERMTLFSRELAITYGNYPYVSFRLFGLDEGEGM